MSNNNNIKHFTAEDIEKYHKGLLSSSAMHELEKAALDDPFLADALEGYTVTGVNAVGDIAELKERLAEKVEGAKVIPLNTSKRHSFKMLRVAALLAFIAGAGLLIYQFEFNKKKDIARAETTKDEVNAIETAEAPTATSTTPSIPGSQSKPVNATSGQAGNAEKINDKPLARDAVSNNVPGQATIVSGKTKRNDDLVPKTSNTQPVAIAPATENEVRNDLSKAAGKSSEKKELAREEANNKLKNASQESDKSGEKNQPTSQNNRAIASSRKADNNQYNAENTFRGRVTDVGNTGVPFANLTTVQDNNAGTYADASGYFNLTHPDSILNVQVKSIGFENTQVQLRNNVASNQVILQDDRRNLPELVLSKQKPNAAARNRVVNVKVEEPEPLDGWDNYDSYLANNLKVPEDFKTKPTYTGTVEISFEVNKNGQPTGIKVEKSLCATCDKEAIRLVKEGPKWNRKAKNARTTITIPF